MIGRKHAAAATALAIAVLAIGCGGDSSQDPHDTHALQTPASSAAPATETAPITPVPSHGASSPTTNGELPPLPFLAYPAARPQEVVRAVYEFAAEHPEVLNYVPCYCGCERSGHGDNEDCFVKSRTPSGTVASWDAHGMG